VTSKTASDSCVQDDAHVDKEQIDGAYVLNVRKILLFLFKRFQCPTALVLVEFCSNCLLQHAQQLCGLHVQDLRNAPLHDEKMGIVDVQLACREHVLYLPAYTSQSGRCCHGPENKARCPENVRGLLGAPIDQVLILTSNLNLQPAMLLEVASAGAVTQNMEMLRKS
jgi:hypothetical protein